ncbi:MAG: hypothetical protein AABY22_26405 [Nanoarchaeota archaeon]
MGNINKIFNKIKNRHILKFRLREGNISFFTEVYNYDNKRNRTYESFDFNGNYHNFARMNLIIKSYCSVHAPNAVVQTRNPDLLFSFNIGAFHSNCGAAIINTIVYHYQDLRIFRNVMELSFEIARNFGYSIAMYSHYDE